MSETYRPLRITGGKDIRGIENEVYGKRENIVADLQYTIRKIVLFIENTNILT